MNILVTGASKGIGYELVKKFAANTNNNIVALSSNINLLQELKTTCNNDYLNDIHIYSIDFLADSFKIDIQNIFANHQHHFDIIINNAGLLINKPFEEITNIDEQNIFQVNFFAPVYIIQKVIPVLDKDKITHIINIGSMGGFQGSSKFPGLSIYSSSKAALANLTECLAEEYKDKNIKINCLALGSVQTEMLNKAFPKYKAEVTSREMAEYIHDFSINGVQYFNGKIIPVSKNTP